MCCQPQDELARNVTLEQGKTLGDARGDVFRGLGAALSLLQSRIRICTEASLYSALTLA